MILKEDIGRVCFVYVDILIAGKTEDKLLTRVIKKLIEAGLQEIKFYVSVQKQMNAASTESVKITTEDLFNAVITVRGSITLVRAQEYCAAVDRFASEVSVAEHF